MKSAIITGNGQVLVLDLDKVFYDSHNNIAELVLNCGAKATTSLNNTIILDQGNMNEEEYKELVKTVSESLVSEEGTITKYSNKNKKTMNKKPRM